MNWIKFNTHGESNEVAFETMCNILFYNWCKDNYRNITYFAYVNGKGGDGGVESYCVLDTNEIIAVQSKWFPSRFNSSNTKQIKDSFLTAINVRPLISKYIVCIPKTLTSLKRKNPNELVKGTEESRWKNLISDLKKLYPSVKIELWDETKIYEQLTTSQGQNIYNFWFDSNSLSVEQIHQAFEVAKSTWAKTKYFPSLYSKGYINDLIGSYLGDYKHVKIRYKALLDLIKDLNELKNAYKVTLNIKSKNSNEENLFSYINTDISTIDKWISLLSENVNFIKNGGTLNSSLLSNRISLLLNKGIYESVYKFHDFYLTFSDIFEKANIVYKKFDILLKAFCINCDNRMLILGGPGSGKTFAIVNEVERMLSDNTHLPILIQAKKYSGNYTWLDILSNALCISNKWSQDELFTALENLALLKSDNGNESFYNIQKKCVIAVDGLDEAIDKNFWLSKIKETKIYENNFPNLKFIFLSRNSLFDSYNHEFDDIINPLPKSGDVNPLLLFDDYIKEFKIEINNLDWVKGMLSTPLSLQLFCDIYRGSKYSLDNNSLVLTNLFKEKIKLIEKRYKEKLNTHSFNSSISHFLMWLVNQFSCRNNLSYKFILENVDNQFKNNFELMMDTLLEEGVLVKSEINNGLFLNECIYSKTSQPFFDYLIAYNLYEKILSGTKFNENVSNDVYCLLSLILLENNSKLISDYKFLKIDPYYQTKFDYYAIANASPEKTSIFFDPLLKKMKKSVDDFRYVFNQIIIPTSRVYNHPLGGKLLDAFLRTFKSSAKRDIYWSMPYEFFNNSKWFSSIDLDSSNLFLLNNDYLNAPLIAVWNLSSLDEKIRRNSRQILFNWGCSYQDEFVKLFEHCIDINDEQVLEELLSIAFGISLYEDVCDNYLINISNFIINNVFSKKGINNLCNSCIRYYSLNIIKIYNNRFASIDIDRFKPPIKNNHYFMPIDISALDSTRMSGYKCIDYDLSRYVLCDDLDIFFNLNSHNKLSNEINNFIEKYNRKYKIDIKDYNTLIISIAYKYLLSQGFKENIHWYFKNIDDMGIDNYIRREFHKADHGARSSMMSISEKYIWIAKHRMQAYFADNLKSCKYIKKPKFINDYADIDSFNDVYQECSNGMHDDTSLDFLNLDCINFAYNTKYGIKSIYHWINKKELPSFKKWINNDDKTLIYCSSFISDELRGLSYDLWVSSCLVDKKMFEKLINYLNTSSYDRNIFMDISQLYAYQDCECYCTPSSICSLYGDKEAESTIKLNNNSLVMYKCVTSCISSFDSGSEKTFYLPSKKIRHLFGISSGDGYDYKDKNDRVILNYMSFGEPWKNQQEFLYINNTDLDKTLKNKYEILYIFQELKEPSKTAKEILFKDSYIDNRRTFLVWFCDNDVKYLKIDLVKKPMSMNENLPMNIIYDL